MADTGKQILMFGLIGAGGYLAYEYWQYSNGVNAIAATNPATSGGPSAAVTGIQSTLPFFTYLSILWGGTGTAQQAQVYAAIQAANAGTTATVTGTTPGTTSTMNQGGQPTSVSTAPPSTTTAPTPLETLAANMTSNLGVSTSSADAWDSAFTQIMGQAIDAKYGFSFDQVYGPNVNGVRNNGATMTALMFLQLAATAKGGSLPGLSGLGAAFVRYQGFVPPMQGNMMFHAHHPLPYGVTYTLRGLGAFTQPTGFEAALFAGRPLSPTRLFGRRAMR